MKKEKRCPITITCCNSSLMKHLPEKLQVASRPFAVLAQHIVETLPSNPERTSALRKLLEAKDCAVRALLFK